LWSTKQTLTKYFSFCQPDFDAELFSVRRVIFDQFSITIQCCHYTLLNTDAAY
jgi:hypothetical protein